MGDVNGDGIVSISDATDIQRHLAELEMIPDEYLPYTRLGHITDKTQAELRELLSNGNVTIVIST